MGDAPGVDRAGESAHDPAVIGVALAAIVSVVVDEDAWDLYDSLVGVTLILVLLAYGRFRRRTVATRSEALAVGAVWAFCVVLVFGFAIDGFQVWLGWPPVGERHPFDGFWFCVVWAVLTVAFAAILHRAGDRLIHPRFRVGVGRRGRGADPAIEA